MNGNIYKYQLEYDEGYTVIDSCRIIKPLSVQMQNGSPCLWAEVDTDDTGHKYIAVALGTGHGLDIMFKFIGSTHKEAIYCGTVQEGPFVYHIYLCEVKEG